MGRPHRSLLTHLLFPPLLLAVVACGTATADPISEPPANGGGAAAGMCLEGTEDCVDADLDGGDLEDPSDLDGSFDLAMARRDAESLLGLTEQDLEIWGDVRIGRVDDEGYSMTMDLQPGRKTVELDSDEDGVPRVTRVVLELPDGDTEVVAAE